MEYPDSSRPRQRRRIELLQEQDAEPVVLVAVGGNHPATTIYDLNNDLVSESLALLGGVGHFRYGPLACKQFLKASEKLGLGSCQFRASGSCQLLFKIIKLYLLYNRKGRSEGAVFQT